MIKRGVLAAATIAAILAGGSAVARHEPDPVTPHMHLGYPARPHGLDAVRARFGAPCNDDARASVIMMRAVDDGKLYPVRYHRLLGDGLSSTNLSWDVPAHLRHTGYDQYLLHGMYGYACRVKADTPYWSLHAWGIAVDINSAYEPVGPTSCNTVWTHLAAIWENHNWYWGRAFGDCMHFQYATGY